MYKLYINEDKRSEFNNYSIAYVEACAMAFTFPDEMIVIEVNDVNFPHCVIVHSDFSIEVIQ